MIKILALIEAILTVTAFRLLDREDGMLMIWNNASDEQRYEMPDYYKAVALDMDIEEYRFFARVVEAESDRTDSIDGRILIASVIINRVNDERFPNTISGVLTQDGQFEVVQSGMCNVSATNLSEWAIVEAYRQLDEGLVPDNLLYFNCVGYNCGTAYGCVDGNYFMCA